MPGPSAPYPALSDVLNAARTRVNDSIVSIGGQTLTNNAAFTPVITNLGWQKLQQELVSLGAPRVLITNYILPNVPPVNNEDASLQVTLSWTGYNNGVNPNTSIVLPQNMIKPTKLSERPTQAAPNIAPFIDLDGPEQGITVIPALPKGNRNQIWLWNNDQINMPGALVPTDIKMDYAGYLPDFTTSPFPGTQTVPILRSQPALSAWIAWAFCVPRGDLDTGLFLQEAQDETKVLAGVRP